MSIPYGVAAVFASGRLSEGNYRNLRDKETLRLIDTCDLSSSEELTAQFPARQGASIDVVLGDGRQLSMGLQDVIPATEAEIRERFRSAAAPIVGGEAARSIEDFIDRLDSKKDAGRLMPLCATKEKARQRSAA
jgi:2-methylcitrate dehydratase PrpD